ncbi:FAD-dependent monooxygenase [Anderseniella sp. Alg231-50]|uniref:FAD-dependent monooxygenase n=1 Tax=Anderseniella sp. Alg231-50 TaxID=1922226 RepID=UPI000D5511B3
MRVSIAGAGPAGLYAAILIRRARPDIDISIFEQNSSDATFGFGVVFSDQALGFLREDDAETAALIEPHMQRWSDIAVVHRSERIAIDGVGFSAIGRLDLLKLLQQRAVQLGIEPVYETRIETAEDLGPADLIIGADGLNSVVRASGRQEFGERMETLSNRFIWYGADCEFDALTQSFVETRLGKFNAHHYRYQAGRSTFIIETTDATWHEAGFAELDADATRAVCEELFADVLDGARLVDNNSTWRQFPNLTCERYYSGNKVLVGDALHTAHFSIGSGTRLALEDVVALVDALKSSDWNIPDALADFQDARHPALQKIVGAATRSAAWYEAFDQHMTLEPWPFALSYIRRAGRLDADKLHRFAPGFTAQLEAHGVSLSI